MKRDVTKTYSTDKDATNKDATKKDTTKKDASQEERCKEEICNEERCNKEGCKKEICNEDILIIGIPRCNEYQIPERTYLPRMKFLSYSQPDKRSEYQKEEAHKIFSGTEKRGTEV